MKLIVTIPAYNEEENIATVIREIPRHISGIDSVEVLVVDDGSIDHTCDVARAAGADIIIRHSRNKGLATTFKRALEEALWRDADIIVNTDGDNHYDQSRIPDLVLPILEERADMTIGSRNINELHAMPFWNKHLNNLGSTLLTKWVGMPRWDVSTGFRAYSRDAALRLGIYSTHTYVHTTLLSAQDLQLTMVEVPIPARQVTRHSRLIKNIPNHVWKASITIIRNVVLFRPLRFFGVLAVILLFLGSWPIVRWLYFVMQGDGRGHIQSLVLSGVLVILSFNSLMLGLLGSSIGWSRKVSEEALYFLRKREFTKDQRSPEEMFPSKLLQIIDEARLALHPPLDRIAFIEMLLHTHTAQSKNVYETHDMEKIKQRLQELGYLE